MAEGGPVDVLDDQGVRPPALTMSHIKTLIAVQAAGVNRAEWKLRTGLPAGRRYRCPRHSARVKQWPQRPAAKPERPTPRAAQPGRPGTRPAAPARAAAARGGRSLPAGNEGAGTVVAAGASEAARALLGKVVAVAGGAMYTQYRCVSASACLELPDGARAADGAASFVNPMTALGMVETLRMEGHLAP